MSRPRLTGMRWNTEEMRREREDVWFAENETQMIEAARTRRGEAERKRRSSESEELRRLHFRRCPKCGEGMTPAAVEEIEVEKCSACEGIFFDRGELEEALIRHDSHRRGFFRKLLGFHP